MNRVFVIREVADDADIAHARRLVTAHGDVRATLIDTLFYELTLE